MIRLIEEFFFKDLLTKILASYREPMKTSAVP